LADSILSLPCGKPFNDLAGECCRTKCPNKNDSQIDLCYAYHKNLREEKKKTKDTSRYGRETEFLPDKYRPYKH